MNVDRFLYQVQQNLPKYEGVITWIEDSAVKVGYGDTGSFEIRYPGGVCYNAATEKTEEFDRLVEEADKTFRTVKEFIDLMENAPELSARDFNMPYKLLAEFNGVVLGGIEHQSNRSFEFTTWSYGNNALYHGHYFTDYEKAKEDFVVRSGLLQSARLFNDKELMQIYWCTEDTLNNGYELSDEQIEVLENVQEKVKEAIPNFDEKLRAEIDREFEDKEKIILDMIETSNRISEEVKLLSIEDLKVPQEGYGIELIGYTDMLGTVLRAESYSNNEVKYKCDAIMSIVLDMLHRELRDDAVYQKLAEGVEHENVQV